MENLNVSKWDKKTMPKDGETMPLTLTFKKQIVEYKDKETGISGQTIYFVNIGQGSGKFRHGETIAILPDGGKITLDCRIKYLPPKDNQAVTISSTKFAIG